MGLLEPLKNLGSRGADSLKNLGSRLKDLGLKELFVRFWVEKRILSLAILGALVLLVLVLCITLAVSASRAPGASPGDRETAAVPREGIIPQEELFLPGEPDFLPPVMLERERRETWTAGDAEPFWRDPLEGGKGPYIERMHREIDAIMERVP
jgi:hypothetical protein